jgi:hypothetical protein
LSSTPARSPVSFWRYSFPSVKGEGWAIIFIDSVGCFAALSDWSDWSYRWNPQGIDEPDFRQFFLTASDDYLLQKFNPQKEYDPEATLENVRSDIADFAEGRADAADIVQREEELLEGFDHLRTESDFDGWVAYSDTALTDTWDLRQDRHSLQAVQFVRKIMPQLREAIRKDLKLETSANPSASEVSPT